MIELIILKKDIKNLRITISRKDGTVVVSVPKNTSEKVLNSFLESKKAWIQKHHQQITQDLVNIKEPVLEKRNFTNKERLAFLTLITQLVNKWSPIIGVSLNKTKPIKIRQMKRCWGNCNLRTKTITLNLSLIFKPLKALEYVVVHELTHLLEPSHNKRFYDLQEKFLPNYKELKKLLNS